MCTPLYEKCGFYGGSGQWYGSTFFFWKWYGSTIGKESFITLKSLESYE